MDLRARTYEEGKEILPGLIIGPLSVGIKCHGKRRLVRENKLHREVDVGG